MSIFGGGTHAISKTANRAMGIDLQGAQYGAPISVVFGQNKVAGNVVWYGDFKATGHQQKQPGKGGGGGSSGTTYTYSSSFELGLCEGPATVLNVYDGASTVSVASSGGITFSGATGQAPWAHLSGNAAIGYSGTALAAFQNLQLGSSASLPNFNFEMAGRNQFGGGIADANPADIVTAICTDTQIGVQFNALGDLTQFKNYCTAAGIFFSPVYSTQNPAQQSLDDQFKYANAAPYFSEGVLKVVPYGDSTITGNGVTYTPNLTAVADLGRDDFITNGPGDPVTIKRIAPADAMNIQRVEYKDRANTYHTSAVVASIDQDVVGNGARAEQSASVDMITTAPVARLVVQNLLQRTYYIRNSYEFQLSWRYCYLEPMDIVTLTDANTGLYLTPVRITEISEDEHGLLSIVAEELPEGIAHGGIYATQGNAGGTVNPNADPGPVDGPYLFRGPGFLVSNNTPEIWCALTGNDPLWAGCDVYLSHDGTSYTYMATTSRRASYGVLSNSLAVHADPDTTGAPNVLLNGPAQLLGGTQADADQFNTLAMVDNEIIAYQTATLAGGPSYTLGYLRRGGYGSAIAAHAANAPFVRLDENILRIPIDPSQIGQTVYLKFVSFNVFGKGGRTLADETAYPYVIGTNVELPDVPVVPAGFAAQSVADGVSLTWTNPNPAAVGCTSIEYATASGGPWTVLAQVGPTHTSYAHHFTDGATYFYRARSRGPLVSAGFSAYTATVTNTGVNVGTIGSNANTAVGQVAQLPVINGGFDIAPTGYGWTADSGTGWTIDTAGNTPGVGPNSAHHVGGTGNGAYRNGGLAACGAGQVYKAQGLVKAVGANGVCYVFISWCDAGGSEIGSTAGNFVTGTTTTGSYAVGTAPAGTVYARTCLAVASHTAGHYYVDNVLCSQYPSTLDEVPDGSSKFGSIHAPTIQAGMFQPGQNLVVNPTAALGALYWTLVTSGFFTTPASSDPNGPYFRSTGNAGSYRTANIVIGAGIPISLSAEMLATGVSSGTFNCVAPCFNASGTYLGAQPILTAVNGSSWTKYTSGPYTTPPGTAYCYVNFYIAGGSTNTNAAIRNIKLEIGDVATPFNDAATQVGNQLANPGSGAQIGDQRNLTAVTFGNYGSGWSGLSLSYTATTTSATISASAATLQAGGVAISYNASSITISGSAGSTVAYYLYYDDPGLTGGAKTLQATTNQITALSSNGRLSIAKLSVTFPSSGTGGGGGGGACVVREAWVRRKTATGYEDVQAGSIVVGDYLRIMNPATGAKRWGRVSYSEPKLTECIRFATADGVDLSCSTTAPIGTTTGTALAPDLLGLRLPADDHGALTRSDVNDVKPIGEQWVQHITCEDDFFLAGNQRGRYVAHHNMKFVP